MKQKINFWIVFVLAFALMVAVATPLFAAETQDSTKVKDGKNTLTRTWSYRFTEGIPEVPSEITQDGAIFELLEASPTKVVDKGRLKSKVFTYQTMKIVKPEIFDKGTAAVRAQFPSTHHINEDTFVGDIVLTTVSPKPIWESFDREVNKTTRVPNLPTNEVDGLPAEQEFEITSDASPDGTTKETLKRATVEFEIAGYDQHGIPNNYTATLTFRGLERYLVFSHYEVTASYEGEIPNGEADMELSATFETGAPVNADTEDQSSDTERRPWGWLAALLAALLSGAVVVIVYASRRNAKLVGHNDEKYANLHIGKDGGKDSRVCLIKKRVIEAAPDSPSYHVIPKISLTGKGYSLRVLCGETLLYEGALEERCELDLETLRSLRVPQEVE